MLKTLIKVLMLYCIFVSFCISAFGEMIPIESAWYGIYGLIYVGSEKKIKLNDIYKVKRGEELIGEFQIIEVKKSYSKGKFLSYKEGLGLSKGDFIIFGENQLFNSESSNLPIVNKQELKKHEEKKEEEPHETKENLVFIKEEKKKEENKKSILEFEVAIEIIIPNKIFCFKTIEGIKEGMVFVLKRRLEEIGKVEIINVHSKFTQAKFINLKEEVELIKGEKVNLIRVRL